MFPSFLDLRVDWFFSYFSIVFVLPLFFWFFFFTADRLTQLVEMSDNRAGGREFEPWRGQHSGSLNNWEKSVAFVIASADG